MIGAPAAALLLVAAAGGAGVPTPVGRTMRDATGTVVRLAVEPGRVVTLGPDLTQLTYDLGAGDALVGVADGCDRPAAALQLPRVGPSGEPSIERILALRPDLVLATALGNPLAVVGRLRDLGVPVIGIVPRPGLEGVAGEMETVAEALGHDAAGRRLAAGFRARIEAVRRRTAGDPRVRACWLVWTDPPITAGSATFLDDLLEVAGGHNACRVGREDYPRLSREDLLLAAPDVLLLATPGSGAGLGEWAATIPAVRDGRVIHVDPDLFLRPTPALAEAAEELAATLAATRPARPAPAPAP